MSKQCPRPLTVNNIDYYYMLDERRLLKRSKGFKVAEVLMFIWNYVQVPRILNS